jgi:uncharacterized protein (DUF302 family)
MADDGIVDIPSNHSVRETVERLRRAVEERSAKIFAIIDHSGEAEQAGLHMPDTKLIIFGSPKAGTGLMLAAPSAALDLPLKILVREGGDGRVWITYNDADYLRLRHGVSEDLAKPLEVVAKLAEAIAG